LLYSRRFAGRCKRWFAFYPSHGRAVLPLPHERHHAPAQTNTSDTGMTWVLVLVADYIKRRFRLLPALSMPFTVLVICTHTHTTHAHTRACGAWFSVRARLHTHTQRAFCTPLCVCHHTTTTPPSHLHLLPPRFCRTHACYLHHTTFTRTPAFTALHTHTTSACAYTCAPRTPSSCIAPAIPQRHPRLPRALRIPDVLLFPSPSRPLLPPHTTFTTALPRLWFALYPVLYTILPLPFAHTHAYWT